MFFSSSSSSSSRRFCEGSGTISLIFGAFTCSSTPSRFRFGTSALPNAPSVEPQHRLSGVGAAASPSSSSSSSPRGLFLPESPLSCATRGTVSLSPSVPWHRRNQPASTEPNVSATVFFSRWYLFGGVGGGFGFSPAVRMRGARPDTEGGRTRSPSLCGASVGGGDGRLALVTRFLGSLGILLGVRGVSCKREEGQMGLR